MQEEEIAIEEGAQVEENDLFDDQGNYDELTAKIRATGMFQYLLSYLSCPPLEDDPVFSKLKNKLIKFFITEEKYRVNGPSKHQLDEEVKTGVRFSFLCKLHECLKRMLREVIITEDKQNQPHYLKKTYEWYIRQQRAVGLVNTA